MKDTAGGKRYYYALIAALCICGVVTALGVFVWAQGRGIEGDTLEPRRVALILLSDGCGEVVPTLGASRFRRSWLDGGWKIYAEPGRYPLVVRTDEGSASAVVHIDASSRGAELYIIADCQSSEPRLSSTDLSIEAPLR